MLNLTRMVEELKSKTLSNNGKVVLKGNEIGKIEFTKKEIMKMPRLKEFSVRYRKKTKSMK